MERVGGEWEKGTGNKKHNWQVQNRQEVVKNSIGNGEAKELICSTCGYELCWGGNTGEGFIMVRDKGEKNGTTVVA